MNSDSDQVVDNNSLSVFDNLSDVFLTGLDNLLGSLLNLLEVNLSLFNNNLQFLDDFDLFMFHGSSQFDLQMFPVFVSSDSSDLESVDGDSDLVDNEVNVVEFDDMFKMNLDTLLLVNSDGLLNGMFDVFLVDNDLLDVFLGFVDFNLHFNDSLLGLGDSLDDKLLLVNVLDVSKSESISDDSSVDNVSSVDDELSSDDQSLSSDDLSGSVDFDLVVVELSLPVLNSQMESVSIFRVSGNVPLESVDVDSWFDDVSSI